MKSTDLCIILLLNSFIVWISFIIGSLGDLQVYNHIIYKQRYFFVFFIHSYNYTWFS